MLGVDAYIVKSRAGDLSGLGALSPVRLTWGASIDLLDNRHHHDFQTPKHDYV